jgi:ELWxxDGT repeat protein
MGLRLMEPNDTLLTATQTGISAGDIGEFTFSGAIGDNSDDVDLFEVELSESTGIFFDINANDLGSSLDPRLRVFDAEGNELAAIDNVDTAGSLDPFIAFRPPVTGTYFVGVSGSSSFDYDPTVEGSSSGSNSTGEYDLILTTSEIENGLSGGAQLVKDIRTGGYPSYPSSFYAQLVSDASNFTEFGGQIFFAATNEETGRELWISDGTAEGTQLLVDINPGTDSNGNPSDSYASNFTEFGGQLFFSANDGEAGNELWVTDGTAEGTQLLLDLNPGRSDYGIPDGSYASDFIEVGGQLFFTANDGETGNELWISDGTAEGTQLLLDVNPSTNSNGNPSSSYARNFTELDGQLLFTANDGQTGEELWISDGTAEGTQLLLDINPRTDSYDNPYSSYARNFTEFDGQLFFTADDGETGRELWVSDGTTEGTQLLLDINSRTDPYGNTYSSNAFDFTEFAGQLFFNADDGETGNELWVTDGTAAGTQLLVDINPGTDSDGNPSGSSVSDLTEVGGQLFFVANDGETGNELWISDGTAEGTQLLKDITPVDGGYDNYAPSNFTAAGDLLFFTANDGFNGQELWVSDGTAEGTQLFQDINPGINGSNPSQLTVVGDQLFFTADDGTTGRELWVATIPDNIISGDDNDNRLNGTAGVDLLNGFAGDDRIRGRDGDDIINGGDGNDLLSGGRGFDSLTGGSGNDRLVGGRDADRLTGGTGNDDLIGGGGSDTFRFEGDLLDGQSDTDTIQNFQAQDTFDFTGYLSAGGSIEATRVSSGLLQIDLNGEDIVNLLGGRNGLNAAEAQLASILA